MNENLFLILTTLVITIMLLNITINSDFNRAENLSNITQNSRILAVVLILNQLFLSTKVKAFPDSIIALSVVVPTTLLQRLHIESNTSGVRL